MGKPDADRRLYIKVGALLVGSALFGLLVMPRLAPAGGKLLDKPAPDFTLPVVAGGDPGARQRLSDLQGMILVLDFWASWCPPCEIQGSILQQVARKHAKDVVVLGINVGEPAAVAKDHAQKRGLTYPILADLEGEVQQLYGAGTLPTVALVDREGKLVFYAQDVVRAERLEQEIARIR
ncbi:MAG: TlpA family protein disulfide reductase [Deltaproteobacteria bacterium]|nr:TlpA family protein disulfide reductase [Deltaproteobacteria bacterium]